MLNEAKTSRPRPKLRGQGWRQSHEAEARTMRLRPRPKIIMKKYQIMINNIWFKIIAGKINKIPPILHDICPKNARLHNKATWLRPRPRPKFWPWGDFGLEDWTSLLLHSMCAATLLVYHIVYMVRSSVHFTCVHTFTSCCHGYTWVTCWCDSVLEQLRQFTCRLSSQLFIIGTCEASWFDSISNRTSDSRFDSYWWSDSKFSNHPRSNRHS